MTNKINIVAQVFDSQWVLMSCLWRNMTNKINIIIEMPNKVSAGACSGLACVADELAF